MFRQTIADAAVSLAKEYSHDQVQPRHIWAAVARHFRLRPEVAPTLVSTQTALNPKGTAYTTPLLSAEAEQLLRSFRDEDATVSALLSAFARSAGGTTAAVSNATATASATVRQQPLEAKPPQSPDAALHPAQPQTVTAVLAELDALIGLTAVKSQVRRLLSVVQANTERRNGGLPEVAANLHLVFSGPPGTGKTTVARIIARLYAAAGALPGSKFVEAGRVDLVAGYVGQTALKTSDAIKRSIPGVLFIDEAYALTQSHGEDYGAEAIATIVKAVEDHRRQFAVIVAGYEDEMNEFISSNPGLRSRFSTTIQFPNFTPDELSLVFASLAAGAGMTLADGVLARASEIFARAIKSPGFGNARFARTLFEESFARMAARAADDGKVELHELHVLTPNDLAWDGSDATGTRPRIGFLSSDS